MFAECEHNIRRIYFVSVYLRIITVYLWDKMKWNSDEKQHRTSERQHKNCELLYSTKECKHEQRTEVNVINGEMQPSEKPHSNQVWNVITNFPRIEQLCSWTSCITPHLNSSWTVFNVFIGMCVRQNRNVWTKSRRSVTIPIQIINMASDEHCSISNRSETIQHILHLWICFLCVHFELN